MMRRLPLAVGLLALAAGLIGGSAAASAAAPPDSDAAADAATRFEEFVDDEGYDVVSPVCVESDEPLTFVCYALTTDGEPVIATTSLASDVVDWEVLAAPGADSSPIDADTEPAESQPATSESAESAPGVTEPTTSEPTTSEPTTSEPTTSEPTTSEPDTSEPDTSTPADFDTLSFFAAVFSAQADEIDGVVGRTQPGSPAEAYVRFQHLFVEVAATDGNEIAQGDVFMTPDGIRVCVTPATCTEITDIEISDGEIVTFSVDGNAIGARLATTGEPVVAATTALRLTVAYQTVTGEQLAAFVEIATEQGDVVDLAGASYVGADGTEQLVAPQFSLGLDVTKLKGNHVALLAFPGAAPGGEIHIAVTPADGSTPVVAVIPVEAITPA